ncbi:MAG TPA: hypothetical protein VEI58_02205 [Chthoniobacterales bacterium]|nr:hypothetical protein [Chthoniobacterales bacterium]
MKIASSRRSSAINPRQSRGASKTGRSAGSSFGVGHLIEFTRNLDLIQTISVLTLVLAIIFQLDHWLFRIVSGICFLMFALRPSSLRQPLFWFALALAGTITIILTWEQVDNHKYLLVYWTWVLFVVHLFRDAEQQKHILLFNARFFLCLIFLAASAQKLASPSYRSGEMFEHYLYVDPRFAAFGKLVGINPVVGDVVTRKMHFLRSPFADVEGNDIHIEGSDRARIAAVAMTWWDLGLQLAIGALLLLRWRRTDEIAHIVLLFFIFTTYLPAPVFGFGWILAIMGFTLAKDKFPRIATAYLLSFFAILLYQLPWRDWVLRS